MTEYEARSIAIVVIVCMLPIHCHQYKKEMKSTRLHMFKNILLQQWIVPRIWEADELNQTGVCSACPPSPPPPPPTHTCLEADLRDKDAPLFKATLSSSDS